MNGWVLAGLTGAGVVWMIHHARETRRRNEAQTAYEARARAQREREAYEALFLDGFDDLQLANIEALPWWLAAAILIPGIPPL